MPGGGSSRAADPAAAEHARAVVHHRRLAGRDRTGGLVEHQLGGGRVEGRGDGLLRRAELGLDRNGAIGVGTEPVDLAEREAGFGERFLGADNDATRLRLDPQHVERLGGGDADALALAHREPGYAVMPPEHGAGGVDDVAGLAGLGAQPRDDLGVGTLRHEADVLAIGLLRDRQGEVPGERAGLVLLQPAERKAQEVELVAGRAVEEIALVARGVGGAVQLRPVGAGDPPRVMPGRQGAGAEVPGGAEKVAKLDPLVAADARDRRLAAAVALGEILDHRLAEPRLVVEHIVRDAEPSRDRRRVAHILPGAAGTLAPGRGAMVVELQRDADDIVTGAREQRRDDRRIDPARHRHDDAVVGRVAGEVDIVERAHRLYVAALSPIRQKSASRRLAVANDAASDGKRPSPPRRANCSSSAAAASLASAWYSALAYISSHSR